MKVRPQSSRGLLQPILFAALIMCCAYAFLQHLDGGLGSTTNILRNMTSEINALERVSASTLRDLHEDLSSLAGLERDKAKTVAGVEEALKKQEHEIREQREMLHKQIDLLVQQTKEVGKLKSEIALHDELRSARPLATRLLKHGDPLEWRQRHFTHHSTYGLIKFSSYRTSANEFVSLFLAALHLHDVRDVHGCSWFSDNGEKLPGKLSLLYHQEHHDMRYETIVAVCELEEDTGQDGGYLIGTIDDEEIVLFQEDEFTPVEPVLPFKSKLTVCGPPLYGHLDARAAWEWMEYNRVITGVDFYHLYDARGIDDDFRAQIKAYIDAGMAEITDVSSIAPYDVWLYGQGLMAHDCMYRSRLTAKWVTMIDLDEYVEAVPPFSFGQLLKIHEDKAWMSHQAVWWGLEQCVPKEREDFFAVERMVFHWPKDLCHEPEDRMYPDKALCLKDVGHRKFIVNPRKGRLLSIHWVMLPAEGGVNLHARKEMRHNHYQGLNVRGRKSHGKTFCNLTMEEHNWWIKDYRVADLVAKVRACPITDRSCVEQLPE